MITGTIDKKGERQLGLLITELAAAGAKPVHEVMRSQARLLCVDLSHHTDRWGMKKAVADKHKKDIDKTILAIYKNVNVILTNMTNIWGKKAAARLRKAIKEGKIKEAERMLSNFLGGSKLTLSAWDRGRAHKQWKQNPKSKPLVILLSGQFKNVSAYRTKQKANVGEAKSGWAKAAQRIGGVKNPTSGIASWAKKGHRTRGAALFRGKDIKTTVSLRNYTTYGVKKSMMTRALKVRIDIIKKNIKIVMRASIKKTKKKTT